MLFPQPFLAVLLLRPTVQLVRELLVRGTQGDPAYAIVDAAAVLLELHLALTNTDAPRCASVAKAWARFQSMTSAGGRPVA